MTLIPKITSVSDYLNIINEIKEKEAENNLFYRGHSDAVFELVPGIYREKRDKNWRRIEDSLIEYEDKIYRDIIAKAPEPFEGKNTLESLSLMQHYGVPTRILDITENPLVALYFACINNNEKEGEVIVFDIPDSHVCHYNSDRITILANLAKYEKEFYYSKDKLPFLQNYKNLLSDYLTSIAEKIPKKNFSETRDMIITNIEKYEFYFFNFFNFFNKEKNTIENIINKNLEDYFIHDDFDDTRFAVFSELINNLFNKFRLEYRSTDHLNNDGKNILLRLFHIQAGVLILEIVDAEILNLKKIINNKYLFKLLHYIKEDKPSFLPVINPDDISSVFAVRPKLNNPRIIRQQGAFLIFGVAFKAPYYSYSFAYKSNNLITKPMALLNNDWILRGYIIDCNKKRIFIDKDAKGIILKELDAMGINEAFLFPEIDKVAGYVTNKYKNMAKELTSR